MKMSPPGDQLLMFNFRAKIVLYFLENEAKSKALSAIL